MQCAGLKSKPKIGSLITIEYIGLTKSGLPESPVFKDRSPDRQDWEWVVSQFPEDSTHKGALRKTVTLEYTGK